MKYFLSLLAIVFTCNVYGQITIVDTPHCLNHTLHAEVTGGLIPTPSGITVDDGWSGVIPIGFTYNFYGVPYTQCIIGSNGCLGFNIGSAGAYNTWPISASLATTAATDIRNVICGPWCDVYIPAGGTIEYSMQGTAPFRNFAVTWCGTRMYSCTTEWLTTQIIIYETTGITEVHIGHRTICLTGWNSQAAIVGVKNSPGTVSTVAPGRDFPTVWATTNEAWRFTPSAGPTYTVGPITYSPIPYAASAIYWYDSSTGAYLGTGPDIIVAPTSGHTYLAAALGCNDTTKAYIHILPATCFHAWANSPCMRDTLKLGAIGDSTGVSYSWTGPGGFTSTMQYPWRYPATLADSGLYRVVKIVGGSPVDTDSIHVVIHPLPIVNISSNGPLCSGMLDTLFLLVSPVSAGETFSWNGPAGFTSAVFNPSVPNFTAVNSGTYYLTATDIFGCHDTGSVYVGIIAPPPAPVITGITQYCYGATFVPFTVTGANILWYPTSSSTVGTTVAPVVPTSTPGTYTYYATQTVGCVSPKDSITVIVYPDITAAFTYYIKRTCNGDTVVVTNTSLNADVFTWDFKTAGNATDTTLLSHVLFYPVQGIHDVVLTASNPVCSKTFDIPINTQHSVQALYTPVPDTQCFGTPITFTNLSQPTLAGVVGQGQITSFLWNYGDGVTDNINFSPLPYSYAAPGIYPVKLRVTDSIGCSDSFTRNVYVLLLTINTVHDTTLCISQPMPIRNIPNQNPDLDLKNYIYSWTPATGLSDATVAEPFFDAFGSYTYYITDQLIVSPAVTCVATDSVHINSVLGAPIGNLTASTAIEYGGSVQLYASGQVYYHWIPDDGSLDNNNINNPVAHPTTTTTYTVYGYDVNGCLDTASVTVFVDSTISDGMPTAFTPNNDGKNDVFMPFGSRFNKLVEFRVYNRWGQQVFYSNNRENGWDGKYYGTPQDIGVYNWVIITAKPDGTTQTFKGNVTLIR